MGQPQTVRFESNGEARTIYDLGVEFNADGTAADLVFDGRCWRFHRRELSEHSAWPVPAIVLVFREFS